MQRWGCLHLDLTTFLRLGMKWFRVTSIPAEEVVLWKWPKLSTSQPIHTLRKGLKNHIRNTVLRIVHFFFFFFKRMRLVESFLSWNL